MKMFGAGKTIGLPYGETRSSVVAERPRVLHVIEDMAKSLKITRNDTAA